MQRGHPSAQTRWYGPRGERRARSLSESVIVQAWGGAAALVAAALVVGGAIDRLGCRARGAAPAVGLAALIVLADAAIQLPGRAVTAAILCLLLALAGLAVLRLRPAADSDDARGGRRLPVVPVLAGAIAAAGAAIPFLANGHVGLLGVSLDNDTANHMMWAQSLRDPAVGHRYGVPTGYPLGPHSLADALASGLGLRLDMAFTALGIATMVLTAIVGAAALRGQSGYKRVIAGACAALLYLVAAYYGEGAFKEPLLGMFLLALVLLFEELRYRTPATTRSRVGALTSVAVIVAGALYVYSYPALAWIGLTIGIWGAAELVLRPGWLRAWRRRLFEVGVPAALAVLMTVVLVAPTAKRIANFAGALGVSPAASGAITTSNAGNLAHPLSAYEALGIWDRTDFRFVPDNLFHAGELGALALGVLIFGLGFSLARRELILPAAVVACGIVYWRSNGSQSPYVTAKALVIAGPVIAVTGMRGLLTTPLRPPPRLLALGRVAVAVTFLFFAAKSTYEVLRNEPVWPPESTNELLSLAHTTRGSSLLFLGASDYADSIFADSDMSTLASNSVSEGLAVPRPNKPNVYGTAFDFDSVDPSVLNRFTWFITTRTTFASQAPAGLRLVVVLPLYELWRRTAPVAPRQVIEPPGAPGAVLDCHTPGGRALAARRGVAAVMAAPVVTPLPGLPPGASERFALRLPSGRWELGLQYESAVDLRLVTPGHTWGMPAYLDRPGPVFDVGTVASDGASIGFTLYAARPSSVTGPNLVAQMLVLVATRLPDTRTLVPLRHTCGRYVDWYRLAGS